MEACNSFEEKIRIKAQKAGAFLTDVAATVSSNRSAILVSVLVMGVLFSFLYLSEYIIEQGEELQRQELLGAARTTAWMAHIPKQDKVCFAIDDEFLVKHKAIASSLADMEDMVRQRQVVSDEPVASTVIPLDKKEMLNIAKAYSFNMTSGVGKSIDGIFTNRETRFTCTVTHGGNYYEIVFWFTSTEQVNGDRGYVPVRIVDGPKQSSETPVTYVPFNNTALFINELAFPVTIEIMSNAQHRDSLTILPGKMTAFHLTPNWSSLGDTVYHYYIKETGIEGDRVSSLKYYVGCIDGRIAESLYRERNFELAFPSYLPAGFKPVCYAEFSTEAVSYVYANQTAIDHYEKKLQGYRPYPNYNPYPDSIYDLVPDEESQGLVPVLGMKYYDRDSAPSLRDSYNELVKGQFPVITEIKLTELDGSEDLILSYYEGERAVAIRAFAEENTAYRFSGFVQLDELVKMARSMD